MRPHLPTRLLLIAWISGVACGSPAPPASRVEIALAAAAEDSAGEPVRIDGGDRIVQLDDRPVDAYVRIPLAAELRFALAPHEVPERGFSVLVASDEREAPARVERVADEAGAWRADLSERAGEVVRIRLRNRTRGSLTWVAPRIEGVTEPSPALLHRNPRSGAHPNVLLYVIDTLRADHLSAYGYERPTSPRIDALAARATLFERAYAASTHTGGSVSSLFTSLPPSEALSALRSDGAGVVTLADAFRAAGYATVAFQANHWLKEYLGFGRGFDEYRVLAPPSASLTEKVRTAEIHDEVMAWIDAGPSQPFFLYVQTLGAHQPYEPPPPYRGRFHTGGTPPRAEPLPPAGLSDARLRHYLALAAQADPDTYDDAIAYADAQFGILLDDLTERGLLDSTLVILTADHGESLGEGGRYLHGTSTAEEQLHVPWILAEPGQSVGHRVRRPVSLLDLAPTVLDRAGVAVPSHFTGRRLGRARPIPRIGAVHGELTATPYFPRSEWFVRDGPWKLVTDGESFRLFHLESDASEERDVAGEHPVRTRYLARILRERSAALDAEGVPAPLDDGLGDAERADLERSLRALGYVE